jgi:hypothetical protein
MTRYDLLTKYKDKPQKIFAWFPKRMTSGKLVFFNHYYCYTTFLSADPRHMQMIQTYYTEKEHFLMKIAG